MKLARSSWRWNGVGIWQAGRWLIHDHASSDAFMLGTDEGCPAAVGCKAAKARVQADSIAPAFRKVLSVPMLTFAPEGEVCLKSARWPSARFAALNRSAFGLTWTPLSSQLMSFRSIDQS